MARYNACSMKNIFETVMAMLLMPSSYKINAEHILIFSHKKAANSNFIRSMKYTIFYI
jgi:hypothetical protein